MSAHNIPQGYSEDTEVFTDEGWKKHGEINNERIAMYDVHSNTMSFEISLSYHSEPYNGKMIEFSNHAGNSIIVSSNHKMLVQNHKDQLKFRDANNLLNTCKRADTAITAPFKNTYTCDPTYKLPKSTKEFNGHTPISEETNIPIEVWFEFLGYFLSEGGRQNDPSNSNHQVTFAQKDNEYSAKMETCFKKIGLHFSKSNKDLHRWTFNRKQLWEELGQFGSYAHMKKIPRKYFKYPNECLKQLADGMLLGDGSIDARDGHYDNYYSSSPQLANNFQELVTLLGIPAKVRLHYLKRKNVPEHHDGYRVYMKKSRFSSFYPKEVDYNGNVVGFETGNKAYMTRRPCSYPTIQGSIDIL